MLRVNRIDPRRPLTRTPVWHAHDGLAQKHASAMVTATSDEAINAPHAPELIDTPEPVDKLLEPDLRSRALWGSVNRVHAAVARLVLTHATPPNVA